MLKADNWAPRRDYKPAYREKLPMNHVAEDCLVTRSDAWVTINAAAALTNLDRSVNSYRVTATGTGLIFELSGNGN